MKRVFIRRPQLHGNLSKLVPADVISEKEGMLRVKIEGERVVTEVKAADTLPATALNQRDRNQIILKRHPESLSSMHNLYGGRR